jgi:hypothetical protein
MTTGNTFNTHQHDLIAAAVRRARCQNQEDFGSDSTAAEVAQDAIDRVVEAFAAVLQTDPCFNQERFMARCEPQQDRGPGILIPAGGSLI